MKKIFTFLVLFCTIGYNLSYADKNTDICTKATNEYNRQVSICNENPLDIPMTVFGEIKGSDSLSNGHIYMYDNKDNLVAKGVIRNGQYGTNKAFDIDSRVNIVSFSGVASIKVRLGRTIYSDVIVEKGSEYNCESSLTFQQNSLCKYDIDLSTAEKASAPTRSVSSSVATNNSSSPFYVEDKQKVGKNPLEAPLNETKEDIEKDNGDNEQAKVVKTQQEKVRGELGTTKVKSISASKVETKLDIFVNTYGRSSDSEIQKMKENVLTEIERYLETGENFDTLKLKAQLLVYKLSIGKVKTYVPKEESTASFGKVLDLLIEKYEKTDNNNIIRLRNTILQDIDLYILEGMNTEEKTRKNLGILFSELVK